MDFRTYFMGMPPPEREPFARRCGTTLGHMRNVAYGKPCAEALAINIERESGGVIPVEMMCPDVDWAVVRAKPAPIEKILTTTREQLGLPAPEEA